MRLSLCLAFSHTHTLSLSLFVSRQIGTLRGHKSTVNSAVWSPDGKRIVSASADNLVKIWNAETMAEVSNLCAVRVERGAGCSFERLQQGLCWKESEMMVVWPARGWSNTLFECRV